MRLRIERGEIPKSGNINVKIKNQSALATTSKSETIDIICTTKTHLIELFKKIYILNLYFFSHIFNIYIYNIKKNCRLTLICS